MVRFAQIPCLAKPDLVKALLLQTLTLVQRRARIHKLRLEAGAAKAAEELEKYDPHNDPNIISGDPYKTLFVAKLNVKFD